MKTITNIIYTAFALFAFACFALSTEAAMEQAADNPNQRVIRVSLQKPLQCAGGGDVIVQGNLVVTFEHPRVGFVIPHSLKLEDFSGTAVTGNRQLEAKNLRFLMGVGHVDPNKKQGRFTVEFIVTGPGLPGGAPLRILVRYSGNTYKYEDGKVTEVIPDDTPAFKCTT